MTLGLIITNLFFYVGILIYGRFFVSDKEFSFLNHFPFEMKNKKEIVNLSFRILLVLLASVSVLMYLYNFYIESEYVLLKIIAFTLVINIVSIMSIFLIDLRNYMLHFVFYSLLLGSSFFSYFMLGYFSIWSHFDIYPLYFSIASFILFVIVIISFLLPLFNKWFKLKKNEDEYLRPKINALGITEWLLILVNIIFNILLLIVKIA